MVATDSQHVAIPAIFGKHEKAVRGARPELAKAPLSLKLSSPTMPPPAVTVAVDTPSCSPAATPPAGPGQPYGPEVHDEEHLVGAPAVCGVRRLHRLGIGVHWPSCILRIFSSLASRIMLARRTSSQPPGTLALMKVSSAPSPQSAP